MNIGVFGGTFNPPHKTHIEIANSAIAALNLDKLIVFPCGQPPHKFCALSKDIRLEMTRLAFCEVAKVEVDDFELKQQGKSYTLETLRYLKGKFPADNLFLILGSDSLFAFDTWHCPDQIVKLATLAVVKRGGESSHFDEILQTRKQQFGIDILQIQSSVSSISSTAVRVRYQYGFDNSEYVSNKVDQFVRKHLLYTDFRYIAERLPKYLTPFRLSHTYFVTLKALEMKSNCSPDKIFVAASLHDIAKELPKSKFADYGFVDDGSIPERAIHAFLGEIVAKKDFAVTDPEILDAIKYHSTAKPNMSELGMLIYSADKLEDSRKYDRTHLFKPTLIETFYATMLDIDKWNKIHRSDGTPWQLTQQAIDYYRQILDTK